jgi:hypothetical protein
MNLNELETREPYSRKLVTGFAPIQIIAVNPTVKKLKEILGTDEVKEPEYISEKNTRLEFWYKNHPMSKLEFKGKFAIWISNNVRISKNDRKQYIDNFTKTVWATNLAHIAEVTSSWDASRKLDMKSIREAKEGEEQIYNLMKAYANASPKTKPFVLDDWNALVKANGSELEAFFNHFNESNGGIKMLLGVREGKYQDAFTGVFLNVNGKVTDYVTSRIVGEYGYKGDFQNNYDLKEYDIESAPSENEVESSATDMFGATSSAAVNPFASTPNTNSASDNPFLDF